MTDTFLAATWPMLNWILFASLKSVVVVGLVLICRRAFADRMSAQQLHSLWFAVIACLAVPIGATINVPSLDRIAMWETSSGPANRELRAQPWRIAQSNNSSEDSAIGGDARSTQARLSNTGALALIWLMGAAALSAIVVWNWGRYLRIRSRARPLADRSTQQQFDRCKQQLGVNRKVLIRESSDIDTPALFGVWSPVLLLPQGLTSQMTSAELRHVFLHELTHVRRHDIALNWLAIGVQILHWFNPLVWWTLRRLRVDMERACDAAVLERLSSDERLQYGHTLIRLSDLYPARLALHHGAGMLDTHSQLKARIHMIAQFGRIRKFNSLLSHALVLTLTVLSVTQLSAAAQPALPALPATPALPAQPALPAKPATAAEPATPASPVAARRMVIKLRYRKAGLMAEIIRPSTGASLLSKDGYMAVDERTNSIVVRDTPERVEDILRTIADLDVPLQQVQIDTRVALVDQSFLSSARGKSLLASLTKEGTDATLDQALAEMVAQRKAELITRPRLITDNQKEARVIQGMNSPQNDQWQTKLNIGITPSIGADHRITVDVSALQETTNTSTGNEIAKYNITTQAIVRDGGVVILRGLYDPPAQGSPQSAKGSTPKTEFLILLTARAVEQSLAVR